MFMCRCVPDYIANRTEGVALPLWCPPLPKPSSYCDCPPPDDVKTAVCYVLYMYISLYNALQRHAGSYIFNVVVLKL